jgi:UDP-N-acetylmuramoyl-tripeptide--D-alanyl-D-alanine ligase
MSERMRLSDFVRRAEKPVRMLGPDALLPEHFAVDSREVRPAGGFVAIPGHRTDGHRFLDEAMGRGARLLLLQSDRCSPSEAERYAASGVSVLLSGDSEACAVALARAWMERIGPRSVIGITGSVGKTTLREAARHAIAASGERVASSPKSFNTRIGCALSVLCAPTDTDIFILEYGANHPGEIAETVALFPPTEAVITEVAPAHMEGFGSLPGVLEAKMEIAGSSALRGLSYNADNVLLKSRVALLPSSLLRRGVGRERGEYRIESLRSSFDREGPRIDFLLRGPDGSVRLGGRFFGGHHARNLAFAWVLARACGLDAGTAAEGLAGLRADRGRGQALRTHGGGVLIDDAYNANPRSVLAGLEALEDLPPQAPSRRIVALGGMRELGSESLSYHRLVLEQLRDRFPVHLLGAEWEPLRPECPPSVRLHGSFESLLEAIRAEDGPDVLYWIKGSRFYELERVVDALSEGPLAPENRR